MLKGLLFISCGGGDTKMGSAQSCYFVKHFSFINQGPVVQSVISLTSSLLVKMLTVLISTIPNSQLVPVPQIYKNYEQFS